MRIVVTFQLSQELELILLSDNVVYRPDLATKGPHATETMLEAVRPDAVITKNAPSAEALGVWRESVPTDRHLCVVCVTDDPGSMVVNGIDIHVVDPKHPEPEIEAFRLVEQAHRRAPKWHNGAPHLLPQQQHVLLVGAGAVNLVTAYHLARAGYQVELLDAGSDPRKPYDWYHQGCTLAGEDARIFSLNESRHHHYKGLHVDARSGSHYRRELGDDGWLYRPDVELSADARRWVRDSERVPVWLAREYNSEIISFNQESERIWRQMITDLPEVFEEARLVHRLLRTYATRDRFEAASKSERAIGAVREELTPEQTKERYPSLREAVEGRQIAGALEVCGFSVNIHRFARAMVDKLETMGAELRWGARVERVMRDGFGTVKGVVVQGELLDADHYVTSVGAFPGSLLEGFECNERILPMIGMWITLPDESPELDVPMKVSRQGYAARGAAEGANIIGGLDARGRKVIHVSSGHGFLGSETTKPRPEALADLGRVVHETAQQLFPSKYQKARDEKLLTEVQRYCIRPWTASGLGLFEIAPSKNGQFIVTGGHNTGGFAQAPAVAQAVLSSLRGEHHRMHSLYAPGRFHDFIRATTDAA